jgi:hypothetical protein
MLFAIFTEKNRPFAIPLDLLRHNLTSAPPGIPILGSYYQGPRRLVLDLEKAFFQSTLH